MDVMEAKDRVGTISTIANDELEVSVSSFGAELQSVKHDGLEYLWQGLPAWWDWRAPILFPIVGALRNDFATTEKGDAPMKIHGVGRLFPHTLINQTETSLTYELRANEATLASYPFDFKLNMTYTLLDGGLLEQKFTVTNCDDTPMPFVVGGHPAFNVPIDPSVDENFEDYVLAFEEPWAYRSPTLNEEHLIDWETRFDVVENSDTKPITHRTFDIDTIIFEDVPGHKLTLRGTKSGRGVTIDFPGFKYCGVWSAMNDGPYVCLEPWTGTATTTDEDDVLAHKRGMTLLAPGDVFERAFTIHPF